MKNIKFLVWEATQACPCKCKHCNRHKMMGNAVGYPDPERFPNLRVLNITGGEPFMHPKLVEVINSFKKLKLVQISTTGYAPMRILRMCEEIKPKLSVSISLDGFKKTHEKIRGVEDLYFQAVITNYYLKKIGVRTSYQFTISQDNILEAEEFLTKFPNTSLVVPVEGSYYGDPKNKVNKQMMLEILYWQNSKRFAYSYYYSHVIQTLKEGRKRKCLFHSDVAKYLDVYNKIHRCHIPDFDCSKCTQLCDSVMHPIFNTREVIGHFMKRLVRKL